MHIESPIARLLVICAAVSLLGSGRAAVGQDDPAGDTAPEARPDAAPRLILNDKAGLFDDQVEEVLRQRTTTFPFPVVIETTPALDGRSLDDAALEGARGSGYNGIYILIAAQEGEIAVLASSDVSEQVDRSAREQIRDAIIAPFGQKQFNRGLRQGVGAIARVLQRRTDDGEEAGGPTGRNVGEGRPLVSRGHVRLSLGGAELILRASEDQARSMGLLVNIAVVDDGGHLVAFARMDGARPGSGYTAQTKAVAAATFRSPTGPIPPGADDPQPILNLGLALTAMAGGGRSTPLYGGVPIELDGQIIGAVGVGGATGEQDAEIARAGIAALLEALERSPAPGGRPTADQP